MVLVFRRPDCRYPICIPWKCRGAQLCAPTGVSFDLKQGWLTRIGSENSGTLLRCWRSRAFGAMHPTRPIFIVGGDATASWTIGIKSYLFLGKRRFWGGGLGSDRPFD